MQPTQPPQCKAPKAHSRYPRALRNPQLTTPQLGAHRATLLLPCPLELDVPAVAALVGAGRLGLTEHADAHLVRVRVRGRVRVRIRVRARVKGER